MAILANLTMQHHLQTDGFSNLFPSPLQIFGMIFSMMLCCAIKRSRDFV